MESDERLKKVSKIKESSGKATKKLGKRKDADEAIATADNITVRLKCRELLEDALKTDGQYYIQFDCCLYTEILSDFIKTAQSLDREYCKDIKTWMECKFC